MPAIGWIARSNFVAPIVGFALRLEQFDGDVVEGSVGFVAGDMREAAARVADLAVSHDQMSFGFALNGIDDVGGTERNVNVGYIVLMEKRGFVRGDAHAENADVIVFQDEMMMRLFRDGDCHGSLRVERKLEQE